MSRRVRGRAVIIINMFFCNYEMREPEGCKNDIENLKTLLSAIHFQVELHENKNAQVFSFSLFQGGAVLAGYTMLRPCYVGPIALCISITFGQKIWDTLSVPCPLPQIRLWSVGIVCAPP